MSSIYKHIGDANGVLLLAFIGGFIDAAGYLRLQGVFTSSITGNLVVMAASVTNSYGALCRSMISLAFTLAAAVGCYVSLRLKLKNKMKLKPLSIILFTLEIILLGVVWILGVIFDDNIIASKSLDDPYLILVACIMGASMGFQNIAVKETFPSFPATTVMTSTLVNLGANGASTFYYSLSNYLIHSTTTTTTTTTTEQNNDEIIKANKSKSADFYNKLIGNIKPVAIFILGGIIGAVTIAHISFHCIFIPILILLFLILDTYLSHVSDSNPVPPPPTAPALSPAVHTGPDIEATTTADKSTTTSTAVVTANK